MPDADIPTGQPEPNETRDFRESLRGTADKVADFIEKCGEEAFRNLLAKIFTFYVPPAASLAIGFWRHGGLAGLIGAFCWLLIAATFRETYWSRQRQVIASQAHQLQAHKDAAARNEETFKERC
jgi:hypothetical protein